MKFNNNTKISDIISHNKASIDAIAAIAPPLKRLKNPILRKVLASRVTVKETAKMGGCKVEDFIRVLSPLGYKFAEADDPGSQNPVQEEKPQWLKSTADADIIRFDVRPIIDKGTDPLKAILQKFKEVPDGKVLCIINTFIPAPLIHLLQKEKAEASYVETIGDKEFHTYFLKKQQQSSHYAQTADDKVMMDDADGFQKVYDNFPKENIQEIDVRALEMPGPMQAILAALETLPEGNALYINHKRVPVYLLEELADKDFEVYISNIADGDVKMLIFKK